MASQKTVLADRLAIVTGASAGIGRVVCRRLVEAGMTVVGLARREQLVEELARELSGSKGKLIAIKCDISNSNDMERVFADIIKNHGPVSVCINNAGFMTKHSLLEGSPAEWKSMLDVNVTALSHLSKLGVNNMKENNTQGHIIHISSQVAHQVFPVDFVHFYTATKFAVRALAEGLRQELRRIESPIRVSTISPGMVETEFIASALGEAGAQALHGAGAGLLPEDIADAVSYILEAPLRVEINDLLITPTLSKATVGSI